MSYLILAHLDDETALFCAAALRKEHGQEAVDVLSPEALAMAPRWVHTLTTVPHSTSPSGLLVHTEITLASGRLLPDEEIRVVFNRLRWADLPHFASASAVDRDYASAEISALWVSWLAGLQMHGVQVINPPTRGGLQPSSNRLEWLRLAAGVGLPITEIQVGLKSQLSERSTRNEYAVLAAGNQVILMDSMLHSDETGLEFPVDMFRRKIALLQEHSGCQLLELRFSLVNGSFNGNFPGDLGWVVTAVNAFPVVRDRTGIEAIVLMLEGAGR